jgi:hypothetical protein
MSQGCHKIVADILKNCSNLVPGIKDVAYLINIEDVDKDSCDFDPNNPLLMTQLILNTTSPEPFAYKIEGYNYSNEHKASMVKKPYQKTWEHGFVFRLFDNTPEDKDWIMNLSDSRFLVIQENNYNKAPDGGTAGRTVFEVLGWDYGLELIAAERDANSDEMLGGWLLTFGCHDKLKESMIPLTLFVGGSLAATRLAIAALSDAW